MKSTNSAGNGALGPVESNNEVVVKCGGENGVPLNSKHFNAFGNTEVSGYLSDVVLFEGEGAGIDRRQCNIEAVHEVINAHYSKSFPP